MSKDHRRFAYALTRPMVCQAYDLRSGPRRRVAASIPAGNRYTRTESRWRSITSSTSPDEAGQLCFGKTAVEDRKLHPLSILFAHFRDLSEARGSRSLRIGDVVGDQYVHGSWKNERRIRAEVSTQMACEQSRLDRGDRPSAHRAPEHSVRNFGFLVLFPRLDEHGSRVVSQVDAATRSVFEVLRPHLPTTYQRNDEPVRQRAKFFSQIQRKGGATRSRAMKEPHLVIESDALQRTCALGHDEPIAKAQHCINGVSRRSPRSRREPHLRLRQHLFKRTEVNPGGVPFDAAYMVARHRIHGAVRSADEFVHRVRRGAHCSPRLFRHATSGSQPSGCFAISPQPSSSPIRATGNRLSLRQTGPCEGEHCRWWFRSHGSGRTRFGAGPKRGYPGSHMHPTPGW